MNLQQNSMCKAIDFIEANLDKSLSIDQIAAVAGYSKAHFQRMFVHYTGQNLTRYMFQRKISEAAKRLVISDEKIVDISLEFGFSSHESFSRAFKKYFHYTPYQYRKNGSILHTKLKKRIARDIILKKMATKVDYIGNEFVPKFEVYGFGYNTMRVEDIYVAWNRLNHTIKHEHGDRFGVIEYNEGSTEFGFEYIAGVLHELENYDRKVEIESNQYAAFKHTGSYDEVSSSFRYIYGKWANDLRLTIKSNYDFERYKKNVEGIFLYVPINN